MPHMQRTKTPTSVGVTERETSSGMALHSSGPSAAPGREDWEANRLCFCLRQVKRVYSKGLMILNGGDDTALQFMTNKATPIGSYAHCQHGKEPYDQKAVVNVSTTSRSINECFCSAA